jgi:hypothetical protein
MASVYPPEDPVPPVYEEPARTAYDVTPPKKTMSPWVIVLIVLASLLILCCICSFAAVLVLRPAFNSAFETIAPLYTGTPFP